ncbi:DUF3592 domain-containing protein [Pedobacter duraquae]|uniref:DUF3592 domain-containing protein n=1 Tax=Pedobacter duraquae TaxID=425511 RepID=A0A4R6IDH4_9SPHI|nr:DUF3592 domain-containing protein [Pedobacter duraquae]TDO20320.1 hypothetical protein CLV32_4080 [Pedobacter duraquae]
MKIKINNTTLLRYVVFWAGTFLVILIFGLIAHRHEYLLAKDGIEASGVVTSVGPDGDYKRPFSGIMSYEFRSADGVLHKASRSGDMLVDLSDGDPNAPKPPYQTTVIYLKDNPDVSTIKRDRTIYSSFESYLLGTLVISLVFLGFYAYRQRKRWEQTGIFATG